MTIDLKKFGYGYMKDEISDITDDLKKAVTQNRNSRFDIAVSSVVTPILVQLIEPWVESCFEKYTEQYFHMKMATGFDFIDDWKRNHNKKYRFIVGSLRRIRNKIELNEDVILPIVLKALQKHGWTIEEWEKNRFRSNLSMLISEIQA